MNFSEENEPVLDEAAMRAGMDSRLEKYRGRSTFEQFALFMGVAQLLELALKDLLVRRLGADPATLENATMGQVKRQLKDRGLRQDFIILLDQVVGYRNQMAHSFLADAVIMREMYGRETRFETAELDKGILALENLSIIFEWTEAHDAWEGGG